MKPTISSNSISFTGLLAIVFIMLKLTETITWSWWWVLSPIWISYAVLALIITVLGGIYIVTKR